MAKTPNIGVEMSKAMFLSMNDIVVRALSTATPVRRGDTAAAWKIQKTDKLNEFNIVNTNGGIIYFLEEGTASHVITPRTKKMLRFALVDKAGNTVQPKFRDAKTASIFRITGKVFIYNKAGIPVIGFVKEGGKIFMFVRKVNHPGTEGLHFVRNTLNDTAMWSEFQKQVEQRLSNTL